MKTCRWTPRPRDRGTALRGGCGIVGLSSLSPSAGGSLYASARVPQTEHKRGRGAVSALPGASSLRSAGHVRLPSRKEVVLEHSHARAPHFACGGCHASAAEARGRGGAPNSPLFRPLCHTGPQTIGGTEPPAKVPGQWVGAAPRRGYHSYHPTLRMRKLRHEGV